LSTLTIDVSGLSINDDTFGASRVGGEDDGFDADCSVLSVGGIDAFLAI